MGFAAAGTAVFQMNSAAQSSALETTPKNWNVSAALRGFYDDNYSTSPNKHGSYGIEVSPTVSATEPLRQTELGIFYSYDLQWYQERADLGQNPYDQSHTLSLWLNHSFNEHVNATLNNNFVVGQEPELLQAGASGAAPTYERLNGNNIADNGTAVLNTDWSPSLSTSLTYGSFLALYSDHGATVSSLLAGGGPSYAGTLNRDQNSVDLEAQWHFTPETLVNVGYQAIIVNYTGNEPIAINPVNSTVEYSDDRDSLAQIGYVGVQHNLLPNLTAAAKVGFEYYDAYNNDISGESNTSLSPYADVSLIYSYMPGCNAQIGFTQQRNATAIIATDSSNGSVTLDQESSTLHASINHHFTPKLLGSVIGTWNASSYNGGAYDNDTDYYYGLGVSANYAFTRNLSGEIDYNYDNLSSDVAGYAYERNRVTVGISLAY